jgi:hypothetical protein
MKLARVGRCGPSDACLAEKEVVDSWRPLASAIEPIVDLEAEDEIIWPTKHCIN